MTEKYCSDCGTTLQRPHPQHANYVVSERFAEEEAVEQTYAMVHTEETRQRLDTLDQRLDKDRQTIAAEAANPNADPTIEVPNGTKTVEQEGGEVETADHEEVEFSIPENLFDHVPVDDPNIVQRDDGVALTYTVTERQPVEKTALLCSDCTDPSEDDILWGVDAE